MTNVVLFPRHRLDRDYLAAHGLALCLNCGGAEGAMPTDCPQAHMSPEVTQAVYDARVDFRRGEWVPGPSEAWAAIARALDHTF